MAGSHGSTLKKYTEDAVIVSPEDWNKLVCAVETLQGEETIDLKHFFAYDSGGNTALSSDWVDVPLDITDVIDSDVFTHTGGNGEITISSSALYEIIAECGFKTDDVAVIEMRLVKQSGESYVEIPGTRGFCSM